MLAVDPGEVVKRLNNLVAEDKWAVAVVAETAKAQVEPREGGNTPTWRVWRRIRQPQLFHHVESAAQLLGVVVDKRTVSEAELVHSCGLQDPGVGDHVLLGCRV